MSEDAEFDFWYAVNNTEVLRTPGSRLETFGNTLVQYHLLTEAMDDVNKVRIREGRIEAYRPQIITPDQMTSVMLEGFGDQAEDYLDWLRHNDQSFVALQYGFSIRKQEVNEHEVTDSLQEVTERVRAELEEASTDDHALLIGVDEPWEVCLLKLMVELIHQSAPRHARQLQADPEGHRHEIEQAFLQASRDSSQVSAVADLLKRYRLFGEYQDRFFALVRSHQ